MVILALFYFYVAMMWREWERLLSTVIKAAKKKSAVLDRACLGPVGKWRERRCSRGFLPRDKPNL